MRDFGAYMNPEPGTTWHAKHYPEPADQCIAYFSAEFGLHESLPIYSGGLGILAGDHCKTRSSDLDLPFVGVGFLYPQGYFQQRIDADGRQQAIYEKLDFAEVPAQPAVDPAGQQVLINVDLPGRQVYAVWRIQVGRVPSSSWTPTSRRTRPRTASCPRLYGGDVQIRISQEVVLGIGGVRVRAGLPADRLAPERGARGLPAAGAHPRAGPGRRAAVRRRAVGREGQRALHHPHAGARGNVRSAST